MRWIFSFLTKLFSEPNNVSAFIQRSPLIRKLVNYIFINFLAKSAKPRPRPFSLASPYTSWKSLTDRSYTGRHLSEDDKERERPELDDVVDLWRRHNDTEIPSSETSLLFAYLAQWFTDSFLRTDFDNREKNLSNHEIDFCQLYGMNNDQTDIIRLNKVGGGGKLRSQIIDGEEYPPFLFDPERVNLANWNWDEPDTWPWNEPGFQPLHKPEKLAFIFQGIPEDRLKHVFVSGLEHGNASVGYMLLNIISLREHIRICDVLAVAHPDWDDERLFQTARNIMIVLLLNIVLGDYIRHISFLKFPFFVQKGMAERQKWYRTNWISLEFNLLYRWHSMVPNKIDIGEQSYSFKKYRSNPNIVLEHGVGPLITAASEQLVGRIGLQNTHPFFFMPLPVKRDSSTGELKSVQERTIDMARKFKLRPMNDYREAFGLKRLKSFDELTDDREMSKRLKKMYTSIDNVEWIVGLYAEKHDRGSMLGSLMTRMVAYDAFTHALTNPLLSKHVYNEDTFSREGLRIIEETKSMSHFVKRNVKDARDLRVSFSTPGNG